MILPNRQAARSLGVPYRSLEGLALRVIQAQGLRLVPKVVSYRMLRRAAARAAPGDDPAGLARAAEGTLRELLRAGVNLESLQRERNSRVSRLAAIAAAYRRLLADEGLVDAAELMWRASELVSEPIPLHLRGFPRLPAAERAFLDAVAAPGSVARLPLPAAADTTLFAENVEAVEDFRRRGWVVEDSSDRNASLGGELARTFVSGKLGGLSSRSLTQGPGNSDTGDVACFGYPDLEAEARGTLAKVKGLLRSGVSPERIAIVARDEEAYGPLLLAVADEYGVPLRVLYQVPLTDTRFGAWLGSLVEALEEDLPFESTARLLAHPLVNALDATAWSGARAEHTSGWEAWRELLPSLGEPWPESGPREEFVELLQGLVDRLGVPANALRWAREVNAASAFFEELRNLPDLPKETTLQSFVGEVGELIRLLTVAARPGRGGVELHTPLSLFGASVDHLFVVGVAEGTLPSPVRPDPLLDPFEREELRAGGHLVEDVASEALREELSFWALLQSAGKSLTLSYPRLLGRSEALPSPYLTRLAIRPRTPPPAAICSAQELRRAVLPGAEVYDAVLDRARHSYAVETRRESEAPYDAHDGVVGLRYLTPSGGLAVTGLVSLASCPFKFFGERILHLAEPDEAAESLEPSLRGKLFHEVLHRVMSNEPAGEERDVSAGERLDPAQSEHHGELARDAALAALDEAFGIAEVELGLVALPTWQLERDQHLATLRRAISSEQFIRSDARVAQLERPFKGVWRGIPVRGRVDRIDAFPEGVELLDYKSGSSISNFAKDSGGRAKVDLQLSIYSEAAAPALAPGKPVAGSRYFSVTRAEDLRAATATDEELDRIASEAKEAWHDGSYPVDPDVNESACRYCPLDPLCRKGPRLERKRHRL